MWKHLVLTILSFLASSNSFIVIPEDEVITGFKGSRGLLSPEQEEFLMELLAADDALIEAKSRGIVDDILQALAGAGGIRVNLVGGSNNPQQTVPASAPAPSNPPQQPSVTFNLVGGSSVEKTLLNSTVSSVVMTMPDISAPSGSPASSTNVTTIGGNNNHLLSTISQVIRNSNSRNVTGIVDESLRIATPAPIREFVTGILNVVYCNSIRRLLARC